MYMCVYIPIKYILIYAGYWTTAPQSAGVDGTMGEPPVWPTRSSQSLFFPLFPFFLPPCLRASPRKGSRLLDFPDGRGKSTRSIVGPRKYKKYRKYGKYALLCPNSNIFLSLHQPQWTCTAPARSNNQTNKPNCESKQLTKQPSACEPRSHDPPIPPQQIQMGSICLCKHPPRLRLTRHP